MGALEARRFVSLAALVAAVAGCQEAPPPPRERPVGSDRLTGVWDVALVKDEAPRTAHKAPIRGTLSFLEPRGPKVVNASDLPELASSVPVAYAVWDIDFSPLGFDPRPVGRVPTAMAALDTSPAAPTVRVVLAPDVSPRVLLIGSWRGDSLVGRWRLVTEGRVGLIASGRFVLIPRRVRVAPVITADSMSGTRP